MVRSAFLKQGKMLLKNATATAQESIPVLAGMMLASSLREATLSQSAWLDEWDQVAQDTIDLLLEPVQLAAGAGMEAGAAALGKQLEIDTGFDLTNPRAVDYLDAHGAEYVAGINETTRERIRTIVRDGAKRGASYTEVANEIADMFVEFAGSSSIVDILLNNVQRSRAEVVAITELGNAYEAGNRIVVDDLAAGGLEMQKSWLTVGDERVDPHCSENQGAGWIPLEDAFPSGHQQPLAHPNCRCTALYRRAPG
jgi:uncharacterized protein with gpF-like domain